MTLTTTLPRQAFWGTALGAKGVPKWGIGGVFGPRAASSFRIGVGVRASSNIYGVANNSEITFTGWGVGHVTNVCTPTPTPQKRIIWISPIFFLTPKIFFGPFFFPKWWWGKACSSPFLSHFVSGCLNDCALSNRWLRGGYESLGHAPPRM